VPFANVKIPAGLADEAAKAELVTRLADALAEFFGEESRQTTMILIEDVPDGGYYRAQEIIAAHKLMGSSNPGE
jgi:4-oxalocrotonate tautomerase